MVSLLGPWSFPSDAHTGSTAHPHAATLSGVSNLHLSPEPRLRWPVTFSFYPQVPHRVTEFRVSKELVVFSPKGVPFSG